MNLNFFSDENSVKDELVTLGNAQMIFKTLF